MTELMKKPLAPADLAPLGTTLDGDALDGHALDGHALDGHALDGHALDGHAVDGVAPASVRELLAELASLEDATRASGAKEPDRLAALAREQEIIDELHRRCPEGTPPT